MDIKAEPKKVVLITGSNGFIASNLIAQLRLDDNTIIKTLGRDATANLEEICQNVDFVFHIAGENRPKDVQDYTRVNVDFTQALLQALTEQQRPIPVVFSSSSQATLDNPYGKSKKNAENAIFNYEKVTHSPVYVFRFPNVFGKWSKPNYNSVVATFCYNVAHDIPLQINDHERVLDLVYIDNVVHSLISCLSESPKKEGGFCVVDSTTQITVGELAQQIKNFWESRTSKVVPDLSNHFNKSLYGTLTSYYEINNLSVKPDVFSDDRGWLFELIKSKHAGQIFVSSTKPGYTRGDHWHHTKVEKFTVIKGTGKLLFRHISSKEIVEYELSDKEIEIIDIPVGYIHSIRNDSDENMLLLIWASEMLDKENPDTNYEKV